MAIHGSESKLSNVGQVLVLQYNLNLKDSYDKKSIMMALDLAAEKVLAIWMPASIESIIEITKRGKK